MAVFSKNRRPKPLPAGNAGQAQIEYVLLLATFGLPMFALFRWLLERMAEYYGMVTFIETLPFP